MIENNPTKTQPTGGSPDGTNPQVEPTRISPWKSLLDSLPDHIISYGLAITALIAVIGFHVKSYDSAMIKFTTFQIGTLIVVAAGLVKMSERGLPELTKEQKYILLPALCFLVWGIISFLLTSHKLTGINELSKRILYLSTFMLIVINFDVRKRNILINFLIVALAISAFYGLIQFFDQRYFPPGPPTVGIDKFVWRRAFGQRVFSTFGNPSTFAGFLILMVPLVLSRFFSALGGKKILYGFLLLLVAANLHWSNAYWMVSGLGYSLLCFTAMVFIYRTGLDRNNKIILLMFSGLILAAVTITTYKYWIGDNHHVLQFRSATWKATVEMIKKRPVTGWGIGSFFVTYPEFRRPEIFILEGKHNTETDHPESEPLELWVEEGIVGLAIFLWFLYRLFSSALRKIKSGGLDPPQKVELIALVSSVFGFLIAICYSNLSYRFISTGFTVWLFLGLACSYIFSTVQVPVSADPDSKVTWNLRNIMVHLMKALLSAVILAVAIGILREFNYAQGLDGFGNPNMVYHHVITWVIFLTAWILGCGCLLALCWYSIRWRSFIMIGVILFLILHSWKLFMADVFHNRAVFFSKQGIWMRSPVYDVKISNYPEDYQLMYQKTGGALEHYDAVRDYNPGYVMNRYFKGNVYNDWGSQYANKTLRKYKNGAITEGNIFRKMVESNWNNALNAYEDTRKLAPNYVQMHHQVGSVHQKWGNFYNDLAKSAKSSGRDDLVLELRVKAKEHWLKALEYYALYNKIDPIFDSNYYRQADIYIKLNRLDDAENSYLDYVKVGEKVDPQLRNRAVKPEAWKRLGDFYKYIKKSPEQAKNAYIKAKEHNLD